MTTHTAVSMEKLEGNETITKLWKNENIHKRKKLKSVAVVLHTVKSVAVVLHTVKINA